MRLKTIPFLANFSFKKYCKYTNLRMSDDLKDSPNEGIDKIYQWKPEEIINQPFKAVNGHVCVVLNREVRIPVPVITELWQNACARVCVDGGGNRWSHFLKIHDNLESRLKPPDLITGDFDSITEETKQYFSSRETRFIHTPDQSATDFTKAVHIIKHILEEQNIQDIIAFHDTSGRLDQIMANLNTLHKFEKEFFNIYLMSCNSLTWLLKPGRHSITIPSNLVEEQRWCALIPLGKEVTNVKSSGLKWDLTNHTLKFGGMVSSSNSYSSCIVEIDTPTSLVWSMGIYDSSDD